MAVLAARLHYHKYKKVDDRYVWHKGSVQINNNISPPYCPICGGGGGGQPELLGYNMGGENPPKTNHTSPLPK